jgi:hypothetical protein
MGQPCLGRALSLSDYEDSRQEPPVGCYEHGNKPHGFTRAGNSSPAPLLLHSHERFCSTETAVGCSAPRG